MDEHSGHAFRASKVDGRWRSGPSDDRSTEYPRGLEEDLKFSIVRANSSGTPRRCLASCLFAKSRKSYLRAFHVLFRFELCSSIKQSHISEWLHRCLQSVGAALRSRAQNPINRERTGNVRNIPHSKAVAVVINNKGFIFKSFDARQTSMSNRW